ncbi:unnamed protein product [Arctogadus glacialis]
MREPHPRCPSSAAVGRYLGDEQRSRATDRPGASTVTPLRLQNPPRGVPNVKSSSAVRGKMSSPRSPSFIHKLKAIHAVVMRMVLIQEHLLMAEVRPLAEANHWEPLQPARTESQKKQGHFPATLAAY